MNNTGATLVFEAHIGYYVQSIAYHNTVIQFSEALYILLLLFLPLIEPRASL